MVVWLDDISNGWHALSDVGKVLKMHKHVSCGLANRYTYTITSHLDLSFKNSGDMSGVTKYPYMIEWVYIDLFL